MKQFGVEDYQTIYQSMQEYTYQRDNETHDEIWCLQHHPVYTQGMNGDSAHIIRPSDIPVVETDRGGQITYHGPGQLIVYFLLDLQRQNCGVRTLVNHLEESVIRVLASFDIPSTRMKGAPGVYVDNKKIAALGIRVKKGCCYHGLSLNVDMDLKPFSNINPCGYSGLEIAQMTDYIGRIEMKHLSNKLIQYFLQISGFTYQSVKSPDGKISTKAYQAA